MKHKMVAVLLVLCMVLSMVPVVSAASSYGKSVNVDALVAAGKKMFSSHEGDYGSVVQNDSGAVGMGIMGWRGPKALQLMKIACKKAPTYAKSVLGATLYNEVVKASDTLVAWNSRSFTASEAKKASKLLASPVGMEAQDQLARMDIEGQIANAWKAGVRTDAAILYYCSVENHYGPGGAITFMKHIRSTLGITTSDTIRSLDQFHGAVVTASKQISFVSCTLNYRTKIYNYIKSDLGWDTTGKTSSAPTVADSVNLCPAAALKDMPAEGGWKHESIDFVLRKGLIKPATKTTFNPNGTMTRGTLVTVLWRLAGKPTVKTTNHFVDVKAGSYYEKAVRWATKNGIVNGISSVRFCPKQVVTREQLAVILFRYAQYKGNAGSIRSTSLKGYPDAADVSSYAYYSMIWARERGVLRTQSSRLNPARYATRVEIAYALMKYCN